MGRLRAGGTYKTFPVPNITTHFGKMVGMSIAERIKRQAASWDVRLNVLAVKRHLWAAR